MAPTLSERLPVFPWDTIEPYRQRAAQHPDGLIDLSIGAPVDRVAAAVRHTLAYAANAPGYPAAQGDEALRIAYTEYLSRAHGVFIDPANSCATVGSKELIATLPLHLGFGPCDIVVIPQLAYPTYEVGALMVGAAVVRADTARELTEAVTTASHESPVARVAGEPRRILIWLNSPANPTGQVLSGDQLRAIVRWSRDHGAIVASDECYLDLGWDTQPQSILDDDVCGGDHTGLLAIHSLSKRSNLAGYRLGFVAGDPQIIADLVTVRKHCGLVVPQPIQDAGVTAFSDDAPVLAQRKRYAARRELLSSVVQRAGFRIDHSEAGLYLWASRDSSDMEALGVFADIGILVAPGSFYGPRGARHVRLALTATDAQIASAAARIGTELAV